MRCFVTRTLPRSLERQIAGYEGVEVWSHDRPIPTPELRRAISDATAVLCQVTDRMDADTLRGARNLRFVMAFSVGLDHIDLPFCEANRIRISHTPGILTEATADLTWSLILACARRVRPAMHFIWNGNFTGFSPTLFLGKELRGSTLGIVGFGKIGKAVAERAKGFGMKVLFTTRSEVKESEFTQVELNTLIRESDILSLHCPLTFATRHLINEKRLQQMKEDAILVNVARGPVVDEKALFRHLQENPHFYAGLDVYEREPEITEGLAALPNVVCLPHLGSATETTRRKMAEMCVEELNRFAKNETLRYEYHYE